MTITTEKRGRFAVLRYTYACGHPGEVHCQTVHLRKFRGLAWGAAAGSCANCAAELRTRAVRIVQNADGLLGVGTAEDAVAWYVHLAAEVPRSAAKALVRRLAARRVLSEEVGACSRQS